MLSIIMLDIALLKLIMQKTKHYYKCKFPISTVKDAHTYFLSLLDSTKSISKPTNLTITQGCETWEYDTFEEFITEYNDADKYWFDHIGRESEKRLLIGGIKSTVTS